MLTITPPGSRHDNEAPAHGSLRGRAVILDFVGVLGRVQTRRDGRRLAALAGLPASDFMVRYWAHRTDYDLGLPDADHWRRTLGRAPAPDLLDALVAADLASLLRLHGHVMRAARMLSERGAGVVVLSNAPNFLARAVERLDALRFVDAFVFSCDVGAAKPDPEAFRVARRSLGARGNDCTIVDDRAENVAAARDLGIRSIHLPDARLLADDPLRSWAGA